MTMDSIMHNFISYCLLFIVSTPIFGSSLVVNHHGIPDYVISELESIIKISGVKQVVISSKKRSVKKQVEVMLDYYIECTKASLNSRKKGCGIERAKRVYHSDCHGGFSEYRKDVSRAENISAMTKALKNSLLELGEQRVCMNHVEIDGSLSKYIAVDINPSSVINHVRFYDAVKANSNVTQFYYPAIKNRPKSLIYDDAFHIEFERDFVDRTSEK